MNDCPHCANSDETCGRPACARAAQLETRERALIAALQEVAEASEGLPTHAYVAGVVRVVFKKLGIVC